MAVTLRDAAGRSLAFDAQPHRRAPVSSSSPAVSAGTGYTIEVDATFGADVIARGRSCSFDVDASKPPTVPVWFSRVGRFAATRGLPVARNDAAMFVWGNGALVAGGSRRRQRAGDDRSV